MATNYPELRLFIGGEWVGGDGRVLQPVLNPATEEVLGQLPHASKADLDRALDAAQRSFPTWRAKPPHERGKILRRAAELLRERTETIARIATLEEGKVLSETRWEVGLSAEIFEWYAEEGRRAYGRVLPQRASGVRMTVLKEPVGPVAAFAPWNFPIGNPARKIGAALGAGCPCILKPAEEAPGSALEVARALADAGLPAGVLSVVFGVPSDVSSYLLASPIIRAISFTGSIPVGKQLMKLAAEGMKRTTMELGGHAPVLVFDDVDVEQVLGPVRVLEVPQRRAGLRVADPFLRAREDLRPLPRRVHAACACAQGRKWAGRRHTDGAAGARPTPRVDGNLAGDARKNGARFHAGGERIKGTGYFWQPTVLSDVPNTARIMNEEPFGPVAILNPFSDFDTAIQQANRLPYGLAAYAFTRSSRNVNLLGEQIEAGMIGINSYAISVPESPFGGIKESGHGSEEGIEGLDACLVTKFVSEA
mgnify:CR=1 FL=1